MKSRVSLEGLSKLFDEESEVSCIPAVQALLAAPLFSSPQQMDPLVWFGSHNFMPDAISDAVLSFIRA